MSHRTVATMPTQCPQLDETEDWWRMAHSTCGCTCGTYR